MIPQPRAVDPDRNVDPDIVVVAISYNSSRHLPDFLEHLAHALDGVESAEVVVVDNASEDGSPDLVRRIAPWVRLVEPGANLGYAAGINYGLRDRSPTKGIYVLNPDAMASPGSIRLLADAVERHPGTGMAVPRVLDVNGRLKFSLRREPTIARAVGEALLGGKRAARVRIIGEQIRDPKHYVDGATADWATGAALFISTAAARDLGLWDEAFFLYSEETDYALRLKNAGYRLRYVWAATVVHPGGDMSKSPWLWSLVAVNRTRLYAKRHPRFPARAYWGVVLLNESTRAALGRETHRAAVRALLESGPPEGTPVSAGQSPRASAARRS